MTEPLGDVVRQLQNAIGDLVRNVISNAQVVQAQPQVVNLEPSLFEPDFDKVLAPIREKVSEVGRKAGEAIKDLGVRAQEAGRRLGSAVSDGASRGFGTVSRLASGAQAQVGRFARAAGDMGRAAASGARDLASLAAGYARAAAQAVINTARTIAMNAAQKAVALATRLWAAAQALVNLAMRLNPVGLIITAITVLVGLIVLAYQRSATFRAIVQAAMRGASAAIGWVVNAARTVVSWVKDHWPLLLGIITGPIGAAVVLVVKNWDRIKSAAIGVKDSIVRAWDSLVHWFTGLGGRIAGAVKGMWDAIPAAFRSAINLIIRGWNGIQFRIPGFHVGPVGFDGFTLNLPHIHELAEGGLVPHRPGGVLALLGEGREDELVVPLSKLGAVAGGPGRGSTVNVYPRAGQSEYEIGRIAARELAWAGKH
jgi:hypothetical protein